MAQWVEQLLSMHETLGLNPNNTWKHRGQNQGNTMDGGAMLVSLLSFLVSDTFSFL